MILTRQILLGVFLALLALGAPLEVAAQSNNTSSVNQVQQNEFEKFAKEILAGIRSKPFKLSKNIDPKSAELYRAKNYAFKNGRRLRFAIWPFHKDTIPIAKNVADGFNDNLLAALLKNNNDQITFVARDALKAIIADLSETGALDSDDDPIAALLTKARDVDGLIQGKMRLVEGGISLGYKAVRMDGTILAQTRRLVLPLKAFDKSLLNDLLTLDQATTKAAEFFADRLNNISEIRIGGLHYHDSGLQPPFSIFFKERIAAALQKAYANVLAGRTLRVRGSRLLRDVQAVPSNTKTLKENRFSEDSSSYLLTGRYWLVNQVVEISLTLKNPQDNGLTWHGRIPLDKLKGLRLKPSGDFEDLRENDGLGPFSFQLTSTRGKNPVYRIGQELTLMLRVGEDAWTYCFYHQADGKVIQIFPNPHYWRDFSSPILAGGAVHSIPGEKLFPFDLKVTAPIGRELVKCFGTSRDVTQELPEDLRGKSLAPIDRYRAENLSKLFRSLPYAAVSEASLVVTVVQ